MDKETLNLLIGLVSGFLIATIPTIINNWFQRKNDERKRKWELEDRQFSIRHEFKKTTIEEAETFLVAYSEAIRNLAFIELKVTASNDVEEIEPEIDKILELNRSTSMFKVANLMSLGDLDIIVSVMKLITLYQTEYNNLFELITRIRNSETINQDEVTKRVYDFGHQTSDLIAKIQAKLGVLAQTAT